MTDKMEQVREEWREILTSEAPHISCASYEGDNKYLMSVIDQFLSIKVGNHTLQELLEMELCFVLPSAYPQQTMDEGYNRGYERGYKSGVVDTYNNMLKQGRPRVKPLHIKS